MSLHEFSKDELADTITLLDRVQITGHKERNAMNKIVHILMNPVKSEKPNANKKEITKP